VTDRIPLEELASLPSVYHPRLDPAGERIACFYDGSGRNELCLIDPETGDLTQVSDGEVPREARYPIEWAPDAETVYFHRDEGGDEQNDVCAFDFDDGVRAVVENDSQCILLDVSPDGRLLYASDAGAQMNLYEHDPAAGERRQLTRYERPVFGGQYDPDGELRVLLLRVAELDSPRLIEERSSYRGCRAWIDLADDASIDPDAATPVLDDAAFAERRAAVRDALE